MQTYLMKLTRVRLFGCIGAAALLLGAGAIANAQDYGSYRDRGQRYQRATSASDTRLRTRVENNTRPDVRSAQRSRATVVHNRATPQHHYVDRGRTSHSRNHIHASSFRHHDRSFRPVSQFSVGASFGHRTYRPAYRPVYQPVYHHSPGYQYVRPYHGYASYGVYHHKPSHVSYHSRYDRYYSPYYRPYGHGTSVSVRYGSAYPRVYSPVISPPRIGFGFYGVYTSSSYGAHYAYRSSSTYRYGPSYRHSVVSYSDYAPRSSASISVRYNYRR